MDVLSIALLDNAYAEARLEITNSNRCGIFFVPFSIQLHQFSVEISEWIEAHYFQEVRILQEKE